MSNAGTFGNGASPEAVISGAAPFQRGACEKLRLLLISEIIAPYRIPVFNALAGLEGLELHVIFLAETDSGLRQWRIYRDEIGFSYEVLPSWRIRSRRANLLLNWGLRSRLKRFAPHAVLCGGYNYPASWEALSWTRRNGARFILWSESNSFDARSGQPWIEALKSRFLRRCDRFVVPGTSSLQYLLSRGSPRERITVAPNAVDNAGFRKQAIGMRGRDGEFRRRLRVPPRFFLFVGRLVKEKGVFDLLESYSKLGAELRSKVGLVFAGDGAARMKLEEAAAGIQPGEVCFPGFMHREELAGLYATADALVLPTHSDPWGLVVNEAMACGLPVIVSSVAGCAADLVEDGWNGYVVPPRDPRRLANALDAVSRDAELRREMGMRSEERIRHYSPEACAQGLAEAALSSGRQA